MDRRPGARQLCACCVSTPLPSPGAATWHTTAEMSIMPDRRCCRSPFEAPWSQPWSRVRPRSPEPAAAPRIRLTSRGARSCSRRSAAPATSCRTPTPRACRARTWTSPSSSPSRTAWAAARSRVWSRTRSTCRMGNQMPADLFEGAGRARRGRVRRERDRQAGRRRRPAAPPARRRPTPRTSSRSRRTRAVSSPTRSRARRPSPARSRCTPRTTPPCRTTSRSRATARGLSCRAARSRRSAPT